MALLSQMMPQKTITADLTVLMYTESKRTELD